MFHLNNLAESEQLRWNAAFEHQRYIEHIVLHRQNLSQTVGNHVIFSGYMHTRFNQTNAYPLAQISCNDNIFENVIATNTNTIV